MCSGKAETPGGWTGIGRSVCDFRAGVNRSVSKIVGKLSPNRHFWKKRVAMLPALRLQGVHVRTIV